ncbi:MAG: 1,2-phenylacetyl-CoA epoxidase subunit PaaE [Ferruginibacter sp.]
MAAHFHSLTVKAVKKETPDCVSVSFTIPENLQEEFIFREGQNITLRKYFDGVEQRRSYSVCNAPHEKELKVAVKKTSGGLFSSFANDELKAGDILDVMPPTGKFNAKETGRNYLAIAAGSGITPVISIIKHTLQTQPISRFTLIYGNQSRGSIIFFEEIEALKNKFMQRFSCINILSRERTDAAINYGRINTEKLDALRNLVDFKGHDEVYICGPEEMIFASAAFLEKNGIAKKNIHFELFTTPGQKRSAAATEVSESPGFAGPKSRVTVKLDGRSFDFDLAYQSNNILDAALAQGADLPYACKGGVCATCKARLVEGEVHMDINYALEEEEVQQGYILTCQSHPLSEKVVVDFDVK